MAGIVIKLGRGVKSTLRRMRKETRDRKLADRCQIVLLAGKGRSQISIADFLGCSRSRVSRVLKRFSEDGIAGIVDRREDNGEVKVTEDYVALLRTVVDGTPQNYGYARPTWTRELLVLVMEDLTGTKVHVGTMSRALKVIGARRGRPKPMVRCPWKKNRKQRRLAELRRLVTNLPRNELVFYEDEVDIHLNPKIGLDWMNRGTQKTVMTPGQNEKAYLAGALNARTGKVEWVGGMKKTSALFIDLLRQLVADHPRVKVIHLILDNYRIHKSKQTEAVLAELGGRVRLHFLPPYCPDHNPIERVWKDLHDNVTRNHRCSTLQDLAQEVLRYLKDRNERGAQPTSTLAA